MRDGQKYLRIMEKVEHAPEYQAPQEGTKAFQGTKDQEQEIRGGKVLTDQSTVPASD